MLRHGRLELVLAFTDDLDGSRGTADMVRTVTKAAAAMSNTVMSWPVRRLQTESNLAPWHRPPTPWRPSLLAPGCQSHRAGPA